MHVDHLAVKPHPEQYQPLALAWIAPCGPMNFSSRGLVRAPKKMMEMRTTISVVVIMVEVCRS